MAKFSEENGGLYRYDDFACYTAKFEEPVSVNYRGYQVYKNPSATQGPAELIALNILEGYDLKGMGHNSADYIHTGVEAVKLAYADREKYLGDMDFIRIPFAGLLSKDYARDRRKLIDPAKASLELRPGDAEKYDREANRSIVFCIRTSRGTQNTPATRVRSSSWTRIGIWSHSSRACTRLSARVW